MVEGADDNRRCFYDASSGNGLGIAAYRELVLTDCEESSREVRLFRPRSWAVCACRIHEVPFTKEEAAALDDAQILLVVCISDGPGLHRYDRVTILQRGERDDVRGTIEFFRKWLPDIVQERRLFLASVPENLDFDEVARAIGAADPIDCP